MHGNHSTRYVRMVNLFGFKDGVKLPCASEKVSVAPLMMKVLSTRKVTVQVVWN